MSTPRETLNGQQPGQHPPALPPSLPPGGQRRRLALTSRYRPVTLSRAFTRTALTDWTWPKPDDILLLVTELVANATLHGGQPLDLLLHADENRLRIEVNDASPNLPVPREPHPPARPGGHGLIIVARTCHRWGTTPQPWGKTVWAEIDAHAPPA